MVENMMLDKKEIIKLILYDGIKRDQYKNLIKKLDLEKEKFPQSYDEYEKDVIERYKPIGQLIWLDEAPAQESKNLENLKAQVKESDYDLRLGKQYLLGEKIYVLDSDKRPFLKIPPHDVVVVLTYEYLRIPEKIVGTFQLSLKLVLKGLMLANGAQIAPGYEGKLACVLFNLTDRPILLKYKEPFAKISFIELTSARKYDGGFQGKTNIQDFIKDWMPTSGLADINDKLEEYHKDLEKHKKDVEDKIRNAIIIILGILSASLAIYNILLRYGLPPSPK